MNSARGEVPPRLERPPVAHRDFPDLRGLLRVPELPQRLRGADGAVAVERVPVLLFGPLLADLDLREAAGVERRVGRGRRVGDDARADGAEQLGRRDHLEAAPAPQLAAEVRRLLAVDQEAVVDVEGGGARCFFGRGRRFFWPGTL